jgi:hypothetical protein
MAARRPRVASDARPTMLDLTTIIRRFVLWTIVCGVSAAPSFMWASHEFDEEAMVVGVALFVLAYTAISCTPAFERFYHRPFVRRTLHIGYGVRVGLSIAFPIGMGADMMPGLLSVGFVERMLGNARDFTGTLATTIVQGTLLNIILLLFMAIVYAVQKTFMRAPEAAPGFEVVMPVIPVEPTRS